MEVEESEDELVTLITQLYEQARSSDIVIESCSRSLSGIIWELQEAGERADAALEAAADADEQTRRVQTGILCEVLESERVVLQECHNKLESRKQLFMKRLMVESALRRTEVLLTQAEQYQLVNSEKGFLP